MVGLIKDENISHILSQHQKTFAEQNSKWFQKLQADGKKRWQETGYPKLKSDEWKYTSLKLIEKSPLYLAQQSDFNQANYLDELKNQFKYYLVIANGFAQKENSHLPEGVQLLESDELLDFYPANKENNFESLNRSFLLLPCILNVPENLIVKDPIHIIQITGVKKTKKGMATVFPRLLVKLGKFSEVCIVENYICPEKTEVFINTVSDYFLQENSHLEHCIVQNENECSKYIGSHRFQLQSHSCLNTFNMSIGSEWARNCLKIYFTGQNAEAHANGLSLVFGKQHVDHQTLIDHLMPNCQSSQLYKGILNDQARVVFNGRIHIHKDAQKTITSQNNNNLLLSDKAEVDSKPQLDIHADDVKATHGATVGQLNPEEIFYCQSRALSETLAIQMLGEGFAKDVISNIKNNLLYEFAINLIKSPLKKVKSYV